MSLEIHFRLSTSKGQFPVEDFFQSVPELVDYYLGLPRLTCCDFQAGYCIDVAGKRWNGDKDGYDFDEPWMTVSWLRGLAIIFGSSSESAHVSFWEQSTATVKRIDKNILEIEDPAAHSGGGACAPAWVDADEFADKIVRASHQYLQLCDLIERELVLRAETIPDEKAEKIRNELYAPIFREQLLELENVRKA